MYIYYGVNRNTGEYRIESAKRRLRDRNLCRTRKAYEDIVKTMAREINQDICNKKGWVIKRMTKDVAPELNFIPCQWYQTLRCNESVCHIEKKGKKQAFLHICEICYLVRKAGVEHATIECEFLAELDELERNPNSEIFPMFLDTVG